MFFACTSYKQMFTSGVQEQIIFAQPVYKDDGVWSGDWGFLIKS
jgi:hypothetical protein